MLREGLSLSSRLPRPVKAVSVRIPNRSGRCTRNCVQWKTVRMYTYEKNMHTGIAHLKKIASGSSQFRMSELTPLGACMKEGLCIGRPISMGQHQERLWE
jgi:hypothetical protein